MALAGVGHDEFYVSPSTQEWDPVIGFAWSIPATDRLASAQP
jgi:hypothetical protein